MEFTRDCEKLFPDSPEEEYRVRDDSEKKGISWGQRKLLLSLVSFLTKYLENKNPVVVYAGAAPGINIGIVAELFPEVTWHLYDPAHMALRTNFQKRIIVYNKCFGETEVNYWKKYQETHGNVYFISDIRTVDHNKITDLTVHENEIINDMKVQQSWTETIKPCRAQLKFRLPYAIPELPETFEYFTGDIYKTPWSPQSSTETRLVVSELKLQNYSCRKYQSQMFYHNNSLRGFENYSSPLTDGKELINDWDSCCELEIWKQYLTVHPLDKTATQLSEWATHQLNQNRRKNRDTLSKLRKDPRAIEKRNQ